MGAVRAKVSGGGVASRLCKSSLVSKTTKRPAKTQPAFPSGNDLALKAFFPVAAEFCALPNGRRHAILALVGADPAVPRTLIRNGSLREMVWSRFGRPAPPGIEAALGKIVDRACKPTTYDALARLLNTKLVAKGVWHALYLTENQIETCAALPPEIQDIGMAATGTPELARRARNALAVAWHVAPPQAERVLDEVRRRYLKGLPAIVRAFEAIRLQPPSTLVLLQSAREFSAARRRFRNCLAKRHWVATAAGLAMFYEWRGAEPAIVELREAGGIWRIAKCLGVDNRGVEPKTLNAITTELKAQAARCAFNVNVQFINTMRRSR